MSIFDELKQAQINALASMVADANVRAEAAERERDTALAALADARALLAEAREYMDHADGCNRKFAEAYRCGCGWVELAPRLDAYLSAHPAKERR